MLCSYADTEDFDYAERNGMLRSCRNYVHARVALAQEPNRGFVRARVALTLGSTSEQFACPEACAQVAFDPQYTSALAVSSETSIAVGRPICGSAGRRRKK